jgi:hypothetical protein
LNPSKIIRKATPRIFSINMKPMEGHTFIRICTASGSKNGPRYETNDVWKHLRTLKLTILFKVSATSGLHYWNIQDVVWNVWQRSMHIIETRWHQHMRGHELKLFKERVRTKLRQQNFTMRLVEAWNSLPTLCGKYT